MGRRKIGIGISYINLIANTLVNIFLTPLLINAFSDTNYGIFKIIQSFASPLIMFNLGVSVIVTKCIVSFEDGTITDIRKKQNTLAMTILSSSLMAILVFAICIFMCTMIPHIYSGSFTENEISLAQKIFLIFALAIILQILSDSFFGIILGHKHYVVHSSVTLAKTLLKALLTVVFVKLGFDIIMISAVNLIISATTLGLTVVYSLVVLKERPRLYYFDKVQFYEIFAYSIAILMQSVVNQVNNSVDNMVLGALVPEKYIITMYSSALTIYLAYNSIVSTVSSYFLPSAIQLVNKKASGSEYTDFIISPGRIQAILATGVIFGFTVLGKNFITLWIGEKYIDAYYVTLMLIIPVTIPLVENAAISILDATLKRKVRSLILFVMALLNVMLTIILVKKMGFWGAAISTTISLIIGHIILMNIYYARQFGIEIGRLFLSIFKGILPCGVLCALLCFFTFKYMPNNFIGFLGKSVAFITIYSILLWLIGINHDEKDMLRDSLRKVKKNQVGM